jgi:hypothetical protein
MHFAARFFAAPLESLEHVSEHGPGHALLAANKLPLAEAYRASLSLAHPPLLILLLNVWRRFGTSELFLRLPSVIAGTVFCWIRWLARLLGPVAGWAGLLLVTFLPPFVELSAEVRQYPLLLCFLITAAYALELASAKNSGGMMVLFFVFLYLAMLTHFSAILFAGAAGTYSLWRVASARTPPRTATIWVAGQLVTLGFLFFLYRTHIVSLNAEHMCIVLANSYFHWGHDHLVQFAFARTFGVLQYAFGQLVVGDLAGVFFLAGVVLLLREKLEVGGSARVVFAATRLVDCAPLCDQLRGRHYGSVSLRRNAALGFSFAVRDRGRRRRAGETDSPETGSRGGWSSGDHCHLPGVRRAPSSVHTPRTSAQGQHDSGHGRNPAAGFTGGHYLRRLPDQLPAQVLSLSRRDTFRFPCFAVASLLLQRLPHDLRELANQYLLRGHISPRLEGHRNHIQTAGRPRHLDLSGRMGYQPGGRVTEKISGFSRPTA